MPQRRVRPLESLYLCNEVGILLLFWNRFLSLSFYVKLERKRGGEVTGTGTGTETGSHGGYFIILNFGTVV